MTLRFLARWSLVPLASVAVVQSLALPASPGAAYSIALIDRAQVLQIAPTSNTCSGAPFVDECRTASQATPFINNGLRAYGVVHPAEIAAVVSLMAFESGDFRYQKNHFPAPGRPGQGSKCCMVLGACARSDELTHVLAMIARNMQSADFNLRYARSISALQAQVTSIASNAASLSADALNSIRQLVLTDEYDLASGAWYLTTQCPGSVRQALQTQGLAGWTTYIQQCVQATVTPARKAYWQRASSALRTGNT